MSGGGACAKHRARWRGAVAEAATAVVLAWTLAVVGGCAKEVNIVLRATPDMNGSRSCYVLARHVDEKMFGAEPYAAVAALVTAPDSTVKAAVVALPGLEDSATVPVPEKGQVAIYAMLGNPEPDGWRVLLPKVPPGTVEIRIEGRRICRIGRGDGGRTCQELLP